jgi:proteasome lid subunit RPN8/RPN11
LEEANPQILLWTASECPFRVTIPVPVLNEVRILAVEAFYSVPRGGVEIGGVFFGVRERDAIHIQAHRPIRCRYATGPSFTLSVDDQLGLSGLLEGADDDPDLAGMRPLGWYHSHTRSELFLSPADLEIYNEFFHERWQIALVLRPANLQATKAGFFFRDRSGMVKSDAPVQEFKLEPPAFGLALLEPHAVVAVPAEARPVALPAPPVASPSVAAPVLTPSVPAVVPVAIAPVAVPPAPLSLPSSQPAAAQAPPPVIPPEPLSTGPPAAAVALAAPNGSVAIVAEPVIRKTPEVTPAAPPEPDPEKLVGLGLRSFNRAESAARQKTRPGWLSVLTIVFVLAACGGAAFLKWGRLAKPAGLGLETYDINGAFLIRWDRDASAIREASHVTLEIEDGGEKTPIELSPVDLGVGGYGYMRRTPQVSVHMKVDGPESVEEYSNFKGVQALGSRPAQSPEASDALSQALQEKEHLKTELINESMQSSELRREITSLRRQLVEERRNTTPPDR